MIFLFQERNLKNYVRKKIIGKKLRIYKLLEDINEIVFIGGSTKIPKVKGIIKKIFPNVNINDSLNPVAKGAAIQAKMIMNSSTKGFTTNYSLGTDEIDGKFVLFKKIQIFLYRYQKIMLLLLIIKLEWILEYIKVKVKNMKKNLFIYLFIYF